MLTEEDDVEIHALAARGWSVSAISRHTGRDRKTIRSYLAASRPARAPALSCLEPYRAYIATRFEDDPHLEATVLYRILLTFPWVFHRGSGGQSPASLSIASAISAAGE